MSAMVKHKENDRFGAVKHCLFYFPLLAIIFSVSLVGVGAVAVLGFHSHIGFFSFPHVFFLHNL
jgi:hypothetical protein